MDRAPARLRWWSARIGLVLLALLLGLAVAELGLRLLRPGSLLHAGHELPWMRNTPEMTNVFEVDPDFGFRPILGGRFYNQYGTLHNDYELSKPQGVSRVLFVGDSVTAGAEITDALADLYGEESYEFWNAGVGSFNTLQELRYYRSYNSQIDPDQVVLFFHLNDFETTPIAFLDDDGRLVVFAPHAPLRTIHPWLFRHSYVYRLLVGVTLGEQRGQEAISKEIGDALRAFRDELAREGIELSVVVLPFFMPSEDWSESESHARRQILGMLEELEIRSFDLLEPLQAALAAEMEVQRTPGDTRHPSRELATLFAQKLHASGLLDPESR